MELQNRVHSLDLPDRLPPVLTGHLHLGGVNPHGHSLELTDYYLLRDGEPCIPVMGEFHFSRYPRQEWEAELLKIKAGGIDIVATYVFWIHVEEQEGVFDWSGNNDLRQFVTLCARHQLQVIVRIGPFAHGECRNGGLPDWLYGRPIRVRSDDPRYLHDVQRLYHSIADQVQGLFFKDNGPIIGVQLENEYMHAGAPWEVTYKLGTEYVPAGSEGATHLLTLKRLAIDAGFDVPLYTCTGWLNSPVPAAEMLPMHGGYAFTPWVPDPTYRQPPTREFLFRNRHLNPVINGAPTYNPSQYPFACCEIGSGTQNTYAHRNVVPPAIVEAMALMNLAGGANLIGYYMLHGGTNPVGRHGYLNEFTVPRLSYDFQAPIGEFGQISDSFRALRLIHLFLAEFGVLIAPMRVTLPDDALDIAPENTTDLRYAVRSNGESGFLFLNNVQDHVAMRDISDVRVELRLDDQTLTIPHPQTPPLLLAKNVCAILPFGLSLAGIRLEYSTAQLLTRIETADATTYFFFAPPAMTSTYSLLSGSFRSLNVGNADRLQIDQRTLITVTPGSDSAVTLTTLEGRTVRLITLTRGQAEHGAKLRLGGADRLVISPATVVPAGDDCLLYSTDQAAIALSIYPPLDALPPGLTEAGTDGCFGRYLALTPPKMVSFTLEMVGSAAATVIFPPDALDGVDEIYLRIAYEGDIGNCFIDGKLVADNFYNGEIWEIGLKRFACDAQATELYILIAPAQQAVGGSTTGMAFRPDSAAEGSALIHSITAVPQYKIRLTGISEG